MRASTTDERGLSNSSWSPWRRFDTAYNNPPAPTITCPGYANGTWTDAAPAADVVCTVKAPGTTGDYSTPGSLKLTVDGTVGEKEPITPTYDQSYVHKTVTFGKGKAGPHSILAVAYARTGKPRSTDQPLAGGLELIGAV